MSLISSDRLKIVIGLGLTGLSCARYLARTGQRFALADTREVPPNLDEIRRIYPNVDIRTGNLDAQFLKQADELVLSPGVAKSHPAIQEALSSGVKLIGDIDLFCREVSAPIVAITGSNAKSTVTSLVGEMAKTAGIDVGVGGNLGLPVLDMLSDGEKALYVLELSSFQLETTHELRAEVATVLNVSQDHLDRYSDMQGYYHAKHRIFRGCKQAVENLDDALTHPLLPAGVPLWGYRLGKSDFRIFGLQDVDGEEWFALGTEPLMPVSMMKMPGRHNVANALSALALGTLSGIPMHAMLATLKAFPGLDHRCQWVAEKQGVAFYNDSKGTNVGATVAALEGLGSELKSPSKLVLIAGGDGKGADFQDLIAPVKAYVKTVVLIGQDADAIQQTLTGSVEVLMANSMEEAVNRSAEVAVPGDVVLLSPACASFDMFKGYADRGQQFVKWVENL